MTQERRKYRRTNSCNLGEEKRKIEKTKEKKNKIRKNLKEKEKK